MIEHMEKIITKVLSDAEVRAMLNIEQHQQIVSIHPIQVNMERHWEFKFQE